MATVAGTGGDGNTISPAIANVGCTNNCSSSSLSLVPSLSLLMLLLLR